MNAQTFSLDPRVSRAERYGKATVTFCVLLMGISYMFNAGDRQVFPALLVAIRKEYGLSLPEAGFVSTIFTFNVAIFAAMSGWFMARFGRRAVLLGGVVSYSLFTLLTPLAGGYVTLATFRALTGIGEALQVGAVFACMGAYFGVNRGAAMGMMQAFFGLGALLGPILGTRIEAASNSWSLPFYVFGGAGILIAILAALFVPKGFTNAGSAEIPARAQPTRDKNAPPLLTRNLVLSALAFAMVGLSFFSYSGLYASFLHTERGFSVIDAGQALGMYGLGAMVAIVGGWLGDRLGRLGTLGALFALGASGWAMFHLDVSPATQCALSFTFGAMQSGFLFPRLMSLSQLSADPKNIGYAGSIALAGFYVPGAFAGLLFGKAVIALGWSVASSLMVALPPLVGVLLMSLYDYQRTHQGDLSGAALIH
jgi:MFS family permease